MKNSFKRILLVAMVVFTILFGNAQQTRESFVLETKYLLYLPDGYAADTSQKWPLLIFLHGSGESGTDLDSVKVHGPPKLVEKGKKFSFIVASPQAPPRTGWRVEILKSMLDDLKKKYRVDADRVYLTGLSMGGYGTWNLSTKYPNEFAAIAPICGGGDPREVWKLRYMPVWCFHGAKDDVVPPAASQEMIDGLKKYNSNVRFTLYPDANHNSWDTTYNNDSLYTWLLAQKKFRHQPVAVKQKTLKEYEGVYVGDVNKDTVRIVLENEKLVAILRRDSIALKAASDTSFFWDDNSIDEVRFIRNSKKAVTGFMLLVDEQLSFRKLAKKPVQR
jgi:dienelactone hydrolase